MSVRGQSARRTSGALRLGERTKRPVGALLGGDRALVRDSRRGRRSGGRRPHGAVADPLLQGLDVLRRELGPAARHSRKAIGVLHRLDERALLRSAGHDRRTGLAAAQQAFARVDAKSGHRRFAMARLAVGGEQRPDPRFEKRDGLLFGRSSRCLCRRLAGAQDRAGQQQPGAAKTGCCPSASATMTASAIKYDAHA